MARAMLDTALRELTHGAAAGEPCPAVALGNVQRELTEGRDALVTLCAEHGVEVPLNLHLADVVEKYVRPLLLGPGR